VATKSKGKPVPPAELPLEVSLAPCVTIGDRLTRIQTLGRKVEEHCRTVAAIESLPGTSAEAREKAAALFLERLTALERALGKTLEELNLG
jgi:hypothetical protein